MIDIGVERMHRSHLSWNDPPMCSFHVSCVNNRRKVGLDRGSITVSRSFLPPKGSSSMIRGSDLTEASDSRSSSISGRGLAAACTGVARRDPTGLCNDESWNADDVPLCARSAARENNIIDMND